MTIEAIEHCDLDRVCTFYHRLGPALRELRPGVTFLTETQYFRVVSEAQPVKTFRAWYVQARNHVCELAVLIQNE